MHEGGTDMDVWKERVQQDINELKNNQTQTHNDVSAIKSDVRTLQTNEKLQDVEISNIKLTLSEIKEDTNWIRRKITGAIISAVVGIVITGVIAGTLAKVLN